MACCCAPRCARTATGSSPSTARRPSPWRRSRRCTTNWWPPPATRSCCCNRPATGCCVSPGISSSRPRPPEDASSLLQPLLEPLQRRVSLFIGHAVADALRHDDLQPVARPLLLVGLLRGGERQAGALDGAVGVLVAAQDQQR